MNKRTGTAVAVAMLWATALVACSDDSGGGATPSDTAAPDESGAPAGSWDGEPCALLTTEVVSDTVGKPMTDGVPDRGEGSVPICRWESTVPSANPDIEDPFYVQLAILPLTDADATTLQQIADDLEHNKVIEGLGDSAVVQCAFSSTDGCPWRDKVYVTVGDRYLVVDVGNFSSPGDFEDGQVEQIVIALATAATPYAATP